MNLSDTRVAVMGAGAVGSYFGGMLARAGALVTLIGRPNHVEAIRKNALLLDTVTFKEHVALNASTQPADVRDAQVVLFCVKTLDTESVARSIAPHLAPDAIVISLQNGVDNIARIRAASGIACPRAPSRIRPASRALARRSHGCIDITFKHQFPGPIPPRPSKFRLLMTGL